MALERLWRCVKFRLLAPFRFLGFAVRFRVVTLNPEVMVIRFGEGRPVDSLKSIHKNWIFTCEWGLSVFVGPGLTLRETAALAGLRHPKLSSATVRELDKAGFRIRSCDRLGHCVIRFDSEPTSDELMRLGDVFGATRGNPNLE
jgi:hypothetical protein